MALSKIKNIVHRATTYPGVKAVFAASPYEGQTTVKGNIFTQFAGFYFKPAWRGDPLADPKLMSLRTTGYGWEYTWNSDSATQAANGQQGGKCYIAVINEYGDNASGLSYYGLAGRDRIFSQETSAAGFVKDEGGVSALRLPDGRSGLRVTAATPDYFLSKTMLAAKLPYLYKPLADAERAAWKLLTRSSSYNTLGYRTIGNYNRDLYAPGSPEATAALTAPFDADPLAGFANFRDAAVLVPGTPMTPAKANENHIIAPLGTASVLYEVLKNHVFSIINGTRSALFTDFIGTDFRSDLDIETDMTYLEVGPGSVNDIIIQAAQMGFWRYWWDAQCRIHFIPDYCCENATLTPLLTIKEGASLLGELSVDLGTSSLPVVNRVVVQSAPLAGFAGDTSDPLTSTFTQARASVYPPGALPGEKGNDIIITGYQGRQGDKIARRAYAFHSRRTTATLSNFPYINVALGLYNRVVSIACKDPLGAFDFSGSPKLFSVDNVSIERQEPDAPGGGYFMATLQMTEIIAYPA